MLYAKKHLTGKMSADTTTVRQLFDMFRKEDMVVVGFIAVCRSGEVIPTFLDGVDDETATSLMVNLSATCQKILIQAQMLRGDPDLN